MANSQNSPPPPDGGASSGSPTVASAASEHTGEKPGKKPWSRPTFYVLTDLIGSSGSPSSPKTNTIEDETIPPLNPSPHLKNYRPTTA